MTARPSTSRVRAALLSSVLAALIVGLICAKYWGRDTDSSASTDGDASGAVLAQATNSRWNLETNIDGAIYHREGTNLWWAGGMLPTNLLANVKNMPSQEQIWAALKSGKERGRR